MSGLHSTVEQLDRCVPRNSPLHRADATAKVVVTLAFIAAVSSLPSSGWFVLAVFIAAVWTSVLVSGVGPLRVARSALIILPFLIVPVPTMFTRPGDLLFSVDLGWFTLTASDEGAKWVAMIILRSWTAVTAAALLTFTTPFKDIVGAMHRLRVPHILVAIISFMYRYLFLLSDEVSRMLRARTARSARWPDGKAPRPVGGTVRWRAKTTGGMAGALFVRTYERSERVHLAMLARGYDGRPPHQAHVIVPVAHGALAALTVAVFAGLAIASRVVAA